MGFFKTRPKTDLPISRVRDILIGDFRGQIRALEEMDVPPNDAEISAPYELSQPITPDEMAWLRVGVKRWFISGYKYTLGTSDITQTITDSGHSVITLSYTASLKYDHRTDNLEERYGDG